MAEKIKPKPRPRAKKMAEPKPYWYLQIKREGEVCACRDPRNTSHAMICRKCYGVGLVGGYLVHARTVDLVPLSKAPLLPAAGNSMDDWALMEFGFVDEMDGLGVISDLACAFGDVLVSCQDPSERWKIIGIDNRLQTRLVQQYEAVAYFRSRRFQAEP